MGGLVARAAAADLHSRVVDAIVTLGTPHARPILTWESSALQWHNRLRQQKVQVPVDEKPLVISIAGGLRDELIPPETCQLPNEPRYLSFLATEIMEMPQDPGKVPPALGMDHKAIVWCHNLLAPVRRILLSLHETRMQPTAKRIGAITDMLKLSAQRSIAERMPHQQVKLRVGLRYWH